MILALYSFICIILGSLSSRFIFGGDSAEFSAVAHTWSISHPPGYPLYSFLLNIITHILPFGTIPWRASLLSVIPTVLTSYLLYKILSYIKINSVISLLTALLYIVLYPVWEYALVPEVFALNSFLVIGVTYLLLVFTSTNKRKFLYFASFIIGLCVAHHHIFVIFVPGWVFLLKDTYQKIIRIKKGVFPLFISFMIGASFYLYAPVASYFNPPIQWENAKTTVGFWRLITRAMYGTFTAYGGSKGDIINQLYDVISLFIFTFQDFRIIGIIVILVGIGVTFKQKNVFTQFLFITTTVHIFFLFYTNFILSNTFSVGMYERFLISFYAILIIYLGIGFNYVYEKTILFVSQQSDKKSMIMITRLFLTVFLIIYLATVAKTNFRSLSYIKNQQDFDRLGKDILDTVPKGGIFYVGSDNANFATMYQVFEAQYKPSVIFLQLNFISQQHYIERFKYKNPQLKYPKTLQSQKDFQSFIKLNKERGIYLDTPAQYGFWMPYGLLWKYYDTQNDGIKDLNRILKINTQLWASVYHIPVLTSNTRNILHLQTIQDQYVESYSNYAKLLFLAHKNKVAQTVMEDIVRKYRPSSNHAKMTIMNLYLLNNQCDEAKKSAQDIITLPDSSLTPEFISSFVNYYLQCDPLNKRLPVLKILMKGNNDKSLTPLKSF